MNKILMAASAALSMIMTAQAFADSTAAANVQTQAGAVAGASVTGVQGGQGVGTAIVGIGPTTQQTTQQVGVNAGGGTSQSGVDYHPIYNSEGTMIPPVLPAIPGVGVPSPQVFTGGFGLPTNIVNIVSSLWLEQKCDPEYTLESNTDQIKGRGVSKDTKIVFVPFPDYLAKRPAVANVTLKHVHTRFKEASAEYVCVGTIMVTAEKGDESDVDVNVARNDAMKFVRDRLQGYEEFFVISPDGSIGTGFGVGTTGSGWTAGLTTAGVLGNNPALGILAGLASAVTSSKASTHQVGQIGRNYWVLAKPQAPGMGTTTFAIGEFAAFYANLNKVTQVPVDGNGKKLEATK